jgi:hypothetical protein
MNHTLLDLALVVSLAACGASAPTPPPRTCPEGCPCGTRCISCTSTCNAASSIVGEDDPDAAVGDDAALGGQLRPN